MARAPKHHAGRLDHRITFQVRSLVTGDRNEQTEIFTPGATVWARRDDKSVSEKTRAGEIAATEMAFFTVRWSAETRAITPVDRVTLASDPTSVYSITGIREIARNEWLEITCVRRAE